MWQNIVLNYDNKENKNKNNNTGLNLLHIAVHLIFHASIENTAHYITEKSNLLRRFTHIHTQMYAYSSQKQIDTYTAVGLLL
jgi:hypothetical protein